MSKAFGEGYKYLMPQWRFLHIGTGNMGYYLGPLGTDWRRGPSNQCERNGSWNIKAELA